MFSEFNQLLQVNAMKLLCNSFSHIKTKATKFDLAITQGHHFYQLFRAGVPNVVCQVSRIPVDHRTFGYRVEDF